MPILKIRDNDNFVTIPALIGPQGPQGEPGEKGPKGDSGINGTNVKVSNTEPSDEEVQIWIDPTGTSEINDLQNSISNIWNIIYPIGSIYMSVNNIDPSILFGGTWERFGQGRTLVGVDSGNINYNSPNKFGGNETHNHGYRVGWYGYYNAVANSDAQAIMLYDYETTTWKSGATDSGMPASIGYNSGLSGSTTNLTSIAHLSAYAHTEAETNIQPYVTCYMWKRIS